MVQAMTESEKQVQLVVDGIQNYIWSMKRASDASVFQNYLFSEAKLSAGRIQSSTHR